jgi:hypothetical protein
MNISINQLIKIKKTQFNLHLMNIILILRLHNLFQLRTSVKIFIKNDNKVFYFTFLKGLSTRH